jgi:tRNA (guanine37-N1)-methyltransferase
VDESISIGDYVLSGGELGALVVLDATLRLVPGVLGNADSVQHESFSEGLLEHPHFTRPSSWEGHDVPDVLLSGHHARIDTWRRRQSLLKTARMRPELLEHVSLTAEENEFLLSELGSNWNEET